jgi:hypothetical protein
MKAARLRSIVFAALMALASDRASATVIDQSYLPLVTVVAQARLEDYQGQSFAIGITGQLELVRVLMGREDSAVQDLQLYIFQEQGNTAQNIHQVTIPYQNIPIGGGVDYPSNYYSRMLAVDLTSLNIFVQQGQQWGFAVHSDIPNGTPQINLFYGCENSASETCGGPNTFNGYAGGSRIAFSSFDSIAADPTISAAFETEISAVPEPSTWAMMILGFAGVGFMAYRRRTGSAALRVA